MAFNPLRGEAKVQIGSVEITLAATMERLADLSDALHCETLQDLFRRLTGTELKTTREAVRLLTISGIQGDKTLQAQKAGQAALAEMTLDDMAKLQTAFLAILSALVRPTSDTPEDSETGNATAVSLN
jgi:hypothetical protein